MYNKKKLVLVLFAVIFVVSMVSADLLAYSYSSSGSSNSYYSSNGYYSNGSNYYSTRDNSYSRSYSNYYRNRTDQNDDNTDSDNNDSNNNNNNNNGGSNSDGSLLKYGMSGQAVRDVQIKLDKLGYDVSASGYYDRDTTLAVMYFQRDHGLNITGKVDNTTKSKINSVYSAKFGSQPSQPDPQPEPGPDPDPQPEPDPEPQPEPEQPSSNLSQLENNMLNMINNARTANGLQPLQMDSRIVNVARKKSQDMIDNNYFSHSSPTYGSPFKMLNDAGISYRTAGENIAGNTSVSGAHAALMNSSGHRKNILNPKFTKVGIGIKKGGPYGMMFTQIFTG